MEKVKTEMKLPLEFGKQAPWWPILFKIELKLLPYELNKDMPDGGMTKREHYAKKFGSAEQGAKAEEYMKMLGQTYIYPVFSFSLTCKRWN
jgi:hypothetical protein